MYRRKKKDNKSFVITIILLIITIVLSSQTDVVSDTGSNLANNILGPVEKFNYTLSSEIMNQLERTFGSKETRSEVQRLEEENKSLVIENARLMTVINREDFLKEEAQATKFSPNDYMKAQVINTDTNSFTKSFTIDKGKKDGVKENDIILQAVGDSKYYTGLVGKVSKVYENTARVETINNQTNDVSFINSDSGDYGIIDSFDSRTIQGFMLDLESEVKNSDTLLTSGLGGVYPYGIYIGRVSSVSMSEDTLRKNISIESPVDFTHIYRVLVLSNDGEYESDQREAAESREESGEDNE